MSASGSVLSPVDARCVVIIPARYGAQRLPGKPLALLGGVPMIVRVLERVSRCARVSRVLVATDDVRIADAVRAHGGTAVLTTGTFETGTDRVAAVARDLDEPIIVNVQGDEPLLDPDTVDRVAAALDDPAVRVATASAPLSEDEVDDPSRVKVVSDARGFAVYFSRARIPHGGPWQVHLGLYAFRRDALLQFAGLARGRLEQAERLEQLRLLEHGVPIRVVGVAAPSRSVDTPEDLARVRAVFGGASASSPSSPPTR